MLTENNSTGDQSQPYLGGRLLCPHCRELAFKDPAKFREHVKVCQGRPQTRGWVAEVGADLDTHRRALTQVGDLLCAIDRKVLRDVVPAWGRVMALAGARVIAEDWTGGRAKFTTPEDRDKAWARLSGMT